MIKTKKSKYAQYTLDYKILCIIHNCVIYMYNMNKSFIHIRTTHIQVYVKGLRYKLKFYLKFTREINKKH